MEENWNLQFRHAFLLLYSSPSLSNMTLLIGVPGFLQPWQTSTYIIFNLATLTWSVEIPPILLDEFLLALNLCLFLVSLFCRCLISSCGTAFSTQCVVWPFQGQEKKTSIGTPNSRLDNVTQPRIRLQRIHKLYISKWRSSFCVDVHYSSDNQINSNLLTLQ